jgi:hypothetical protein
MMRSALLLGICAALTGAWTSQSATADLVANAWPDQRVAPGDTLSASEPRRLDSLAAVTCIQNWHEGQRLVPMASRLSRLGGATLWPDEWPGPDGGLGGVGRRLPRQRARLGGRRAAWWAAQA